MGFGMCKNDKTGTKLPGILKIPPSKSSDEQAIIIHSFSQTAITVTDTSDSVKTVAFYSNTFSSRVFAAAYNADVFQTSLRTTHIFKYLQIYTVKLL
jgi:hypothetical protein